MHRARRSWHALALRPRLLIALVVAGVGLAAALWLPTRNDSAAATENGWDRQQSQGDHRNDRDRGWWRDRDGRHRRDRQSPTPSADPTTPPTSEPPTSAPATTPPTSAAPEATRWAPFTTYVADQLVTFDGVEYQVKQTHTSLPGWEPPALPKLFKPLV
jgi:pyruvate/2-oxoglutarate dehydrogenase complex dihydrolipoamide acyltransferase (E2) component